MKMSCDIESIIAQGANEMNIELPPGVEAAFKAYYDFLKERGRNVNLTAISAPEEVANLHFLDSLALLNATEFKNKSVIDIGSGAGFPGVPLKLTEPSIKISLLEATGKRVAFLSELSNKLKIDAACINARAEEAAHGPEYREQYDIAVSRAVARLGMLCELCLPFVRDGGIFVAMKSVDTADEIEETKSAINVLGAKLLNHFDYKIPGTDIIHRAVRIRKNNKIDNKYPRRFAKIQKDPL